MPIQQGMNQQSPAVVNTIRRGLSRVSGARRRKRSSAKRAAGTSSRKRKSRKLKFGSPAWRKKYLKKR